MCLEMGLKSEKFLHHPSYVIFKRLGVGGEENFKPQPTNRPPSFLHTEPKL